LRNILLLIDYAAPYRGNFIPSILNLASHCEREGMRTIFIFPEVAREIPWVIEFQKERGAVFFIDRSFFSKKVKYSNIKKVKDIIRKEKIGIIHTHFLAYNYSLVILKLFFTGRVRFIANYMNELVLPRNIYFRFKIMVTRLTFDLYIASSKGVKKSLINAGITERRIVTVYNSLDPVHLDIYESLELRQNIEEKIILMFGWTFFRKGVDIAIRAIKELVEDGNNLRLVIAMAGGQEIIENEINKLEGTIPSWITLKGPVQNVATYYNSADIFLSSSREEGFTYSVLEAAYCNPLLIMSRIEGHPLDIPFSGSFISENITELKSSILKVLGINPTEKKRIKQLQREYVISTFDINRWSQAILNEYSKLV